MFLYSPCIGTFPHIYFDYKKFWSSIFRSRYVWRLKNPILSFPVPRRKKPQIYDRVSGKTCLHSCILHYTRSNIRCIPEKCSAPDSPVLEGKIRKCRCHCGKGLAILSLRQNILGVSINPSYQGLVKQRRLYLQIKPHHNSIGGQNKATQQITSRKCRR